MASVSFSDTQPLIRGVTDAQAVELFEVVQSLRYGPGDVVSGQAQSPDVRKFPDLFWNWPEQGVPADGERGFPAMAGKRAVSSHAGRVGLTWAGVPDSAIMRQVR